MKVMQMKNNLYYIFIFSFILSVCITQNAYKYKLSSMDSKKIKQAKKLEKMGNIKEAEYIYESILTEKPYVKEAFSPLKQIYINKNNANDFIPYVESYINSHNNNIIKQIEIIEIYLLANNAKWESIANNVIQYSINRKYFSQSKNVIYILLNNDKELYALKIIKTLREAWNKPEFYALELGRYYTLKNDFEKSMDEFLIYNQYTKNTTTTISNNIMNLLDFGADENMIRKKLNNKNTEKRKIILFDLEFKLKNYNECYNVLKKLNDETIKITFIKDLIKLDLIELAEVIINDILNTSKDTKILNACIFELARIYEIKLSTDEVNLNLSSEIYHNELLDSPIIKINTNQGQSLNRAINIYDSLGTKNNDGKSLLNLSEIKYRILGDLDGANTLYNQMYNRYKNNDKTISTISLSRIIDIHIAKGELNMANEYIKKNIDQLKFDENKEILKIKLLQLYFYDGNLSLLINESNELLKVLSKNHLLYNDILDMLSIAYLFEDENEFKNYTNIKLKIFQNKRTQAIKSLSEINFNNDIINNLAKYELAYLLYLQEDYEKAIIVIDTISQNSIYNEYGLILKAEINDIALNNYDVAIAQYDKFIELYPKSIFYESIRLRLRKLIDLKLEL